MMSKSEMEELIEIGCSLVVNLGSSQDAYNKGVIDMLSAALLPEINDDRAAWLIKLIIDARG